MNVIEQLKIHEGFRGNYYLCTGGKKTIGFGRNTDDNPFSITEIQFLCRTEFDETPMTKQEAHYLLINDVLKVISLIQNRLPWGALSEVRRGACVNMAFNLGVEGFFKFKKMIKALEGNRFQLAASEMLDSRWANQVSNRALELAKQMSTGKFAE